MIFNLFNGGKNTKLTIHNFTVYLIEAIKNTMKTFSTDLSPVLLDYSTQSGTAVRGFMCVCVCAAKGGG